MSSLGLYEILLEQVVFGSVLFLLTYFIQLILRRSSYCHYSSFLWFSYFLVLMIPLQSVVKNLVPAKVKAITYVNFSLPEARQEIIPVLEKSWDYLAPESLIIYWIFGAVVSFIFFMFIPLFKQSRFSKALIERSEVYNELLPGDIQLHESVSLYVSDTTTLPFVVGIFKPKIIIPRELIDQLSPVQLKAVIYHELAHVLNRDLQKILISRLVMSFFWFFPLTFWAYVKMREAQEFVADELPLEKLSHNFKEYGESLLKISQLNLVHQEGVFGVSILNKHHLTRRLEMILRLKKFKKKSVLIPSIILLVLITASIFFIGIEGQKESGPYVTINAVVKKDDVTIAKPSIIARVGQDASIISFSEDKNREGFGSRLKLSTNYNGKYLHVVGSLCYEKMSQIEYMSGNPVKTDISCKGKWEFETQSEMGKKAHIQIPEKNIVLEITAFEGARTGKFLDHLGKPGKDKKISSFTYSGDEAPDFIKEKIKEVIEQKYAGKSKEFKKKKIKEAIAFQIDNKSANFLVPQDLDQLDQLDELDNLDDELGDDNDGKKTARAIRSKKDKTYRMPSEGYFEGMKPVGSVSQENYVYNQEKTAKMLKALLREEMLRANGGKIDEELDDIDYINKSIQLITGHRGKTKY